MRARWLGIIVRVVSTVFALVLAAPVALLLTLMVAGTGDPGKQIVMPWPVVLTHLALALLLPLVTAITIGWWGLWAARL
jgi:hypothetical protein